MKWEGRRQSDNLEDRRGMGNTGKVIAGGGALGLIFLLVQLFLGGDSAQVAQALENQLNQNTQQQQAVELTAEEKVVGQFISTVLASTEDTWHRVFREKGMTYREPKMILFKDVIQSACGGASGNTGPFYCPGDETLYMDMSFFNTLRDRFGAEGGDFAIAYVIAHEVGHHVQHQLGVLDKTQNMRRQLREAQGNQVQVATELQADFFAGVWAHYEQKYLEEGDVEEAINAAAAVGDDNIQNATQGYTRPETYTHGTSEQRMKWFTKGFKTGDIGAGDTFGELL
ncbi:MAG: neutral zinc metallopeptidase [Saprospiraceae bacterium]|jgi:predicted metalloprotease|nr:neutral zinc metallopeptidase [Saprospiraceae bacterium]MBK6664896.1 neutral zinc metallopeptidase [Saprospiraceae bacterium]MBK8828812.1 neutral zinc metallopeptidase [Saprospiraceae bacterium]MBK8885734.1 neutral zinc metallopeptidase [Saprospiraceae bacterium]MBK9581566.1 neutral zinc metallopeptidase [Saprospiraceae bacterium]